MISDAVDLAKKLCSESLLSEAEVDHQKSKRKKESTSTMDSFKLLKSELISVMRDKKISWSRKRHCFDLLSRLCVRIDMEISSVKLLTSAKIENSSRNLWKRLSVSLQMTDQKLLKLLCTTRSRFCIRSRFVISVLLHGFV